MCSESGLGNFIVDRAGKTIQKQLVYLQTDIEVHSGEHGRSNPLYLTQPASSSPAQLPLADLPS